MLWLVVGATLNVAVAWGLAAWLPHERWMGTVVADASTPDEARYLELYRTTGAMRRSWSSTRKPLNKPVFYNVIQKPRTADLGHRYKCELSGWGIAIREYRRPSSPISTGLDHATGWPSLTLWYAFTETSSRSSSVQGAYVLDYGFSTRSVPTSSQMRALPLNPIWPGFILNTTFYAPIACGLWHAPILISRYRRHRRRIRGLCVKCAYNRAGLAPQAPCPECGDVPRPAASVASV